MITELILHEDSDTLQCFEIISFLRTTLPFQVLYRWNRSGVIVTVPRNVIVNVISQYDNLLALNRSGIIPELTDKAGAVEWSQCQ